MSADLRLQQLGAAGDDHFLGQRADAHLQIDLRAALHVDANVAPHGAPESLQLGGNGVGADTQARENELAAIVGDRRRREAGAVLGRDHRDTRQHGAAVVGDRPTMTPVSICA